MNSVADPIARPYRQLARNARLANARLDRACMALEPGEWEAPRTSFFPSLKETMVHLLNADRYCIDSLRGDRRGLPEPPGDRNTPAEFASERAEIDDWLVGFCESVTAEDLAREIRIPWPEKTITETVADTLLRDERSAAAVRRVHPVRRYRAARGGPEDAGLDRGAADAIVR